MAHAMQHCSRSWWKRPPVWVLALVILGALGFVVLKETGRPSPMPYGAFLDQLDAGNVASVTFYGTEIDGRFRHALNAALPTGTVKRDDFRSRIPDFGDPGLISELRKQHTAIDVSAPSQWTSLFAHLPWPLVAFLGIALVAAVVRILRGPRGGLHSAMPMRPGGPIIGLASTLFGNKREVEEASRQDRRSGDTHGGPGGK